MQVVLHVNRHTPIYFTITTRHALSVYQSVISLVHPLQQVILFSDCRLFRERHLHSSPRPSLYWRNHNGPVHILQHVNVSISDWRICNCHARIPKNEHVCISNWRSRFDHANIQYDEHVSDLDDKIPSCQNGFICCCAITNSEGYGPKMDHFERSNTGLVTVRRKVSTLMSPQATQTDINQLRRFTRPNVSGWRVYKSNTTKQISHLYSCIHIQYITMR